MRRVLWRNAWLIALVTVVAGAAAFGFSRLQDKQFRADATVLVAADDEGLFVEPDGSRTDPDRYLASELLAFTGDDVQEDLVEEYGPIAKRVSVRASRGANAITIELQGRQPRLIAEIVNAYAERYIEVRRERVVDQMEEATRQLQVLIDGLQEQIDATSFQLGAAAAADAQAQAAAAAAAADSPGTDPRPSPNPEVVRLEQQRTSLLQQQDVLEQRRGELLVDQTLQTGNARLVEEAEPPTRPVQPTTRRNVALAVPVGLIVGVALALLRDHFDDRLRTRADLESITDVPTLVAIPSSPRLRSGALAPPRSTEAEAYRTLHAVLQARGLGADARVLQVTGPTVDSGATTTATNLAVSLARAGQRVLLVDGDLRIPTLADLLDPPPPTGIAEVLAERTPLDEVVRSLPEVPGLEVLAVGTDARPAPDLLARPEMSDLIDAARRRADVVVIDSPPVLAFSDAPLLARLVDAVVVVVRAGRATEAELQRTIEVLHAVDAPIAGVALNRVARGDAMEFADSRIFSGALAGAPTPTS